MKKFNKILKNQKGLTLIELLAVIVILAIVAAIAVPSISNIIAKQQDKAILADTSTILSGAKLAAANGECGTGDSLTCSDTVLKSYIESTKITGTIGATKTSGVWTITYPALSNVDKITVVFANTDKTQITEQALLTAMGN